MSQLRKGIWMGIELGVWSPGRQESGSQKVRGQEVGKFEVTEFIPSGGEPII